MTIRSTYISRWITAICLSIFTTDLQSQTIPTGETVLEETIRRNELKGNRISGSSYMIRPLQPSNNSSYDSMMQAITGSAPVKPRFFLKGKGSIRVLPAALQQQFNSNHSYGWNDGSMFPSKGYQMRATAGFQAQIGILSIQVKPELVHASNRPFKELSPAHSDSAWFRYYEFLNGIDMPQQFGNRPLTKLLPGQSSIRINYKGMSVGLSSENLWWGPGSRNALVMSNTAPGFYHLSFNSTRPHSTFLGKFEWQLIAGRLENSGILPLDTSRLFEGQPLYQPKSASNRYINAFVINWQPKWIKGLELGFTRSFFQYSNNIQGGLNGYLPVFTSFFKGNARDESSFGRDQLLSFYFRWVFAQEKAEIYGEWGRNDHAGNLSDFVQEPEHSRAYIAGFRKLFSRSKGRELEFFAELTQLQMPSTLVVRAMQPWYAHYQVRHGYTHRGQVIGAGIGPGSNSQTAGLNWIGKKLNKTGLFAERIVRNNDFYYSAFSGIGNYEGHWVDLSLNANKTWHINRFLYTAQLSLIRTFNYQWRTKEIPATLDGGKENLFHAQVGLSVGYLF